MEMMEEEMMVSLSASFVVAGGGERGDEGCSFVNDVASCERTRVFLAGAGSFSTSQKSLASPLSEDFSAADSFFFTSARTGGEATFD